MAGGTPSGCLGGCATDADCNDGNACTVDACASGQCTHVDVDCNDGNACTDDICSGGACSHPSIDCNDGDVCTIDGCDAASGCTNVVDPTCVDPCGDGVCDVSSEDCTSCPSDCNGITRGRKSDRFCCGSDADCSDPRCSQGATCSGTLGATGAGAPGLSVASLARAQAIKARHSLELLAIDDVVGNGIGAGPDGEPVIEVYLGRRNALSESKIPASIEGVRVRTEVTGPFVAYCP